ncbi:multicopper oxidase family protein [Streptomyces decoyicus]
MRLRSQGGKSFAGALLAVLALVSGCSNSGAEHDPASSPSDSSWASARSAHALRNPAEVVSKDGLLRTRIVVERKKVELAGRKLWALTYNGQYMPPTLRIKPGDRMELAVVNKIDKVTNLHVHGLHVSPSGNSDNIFLAIEPGQTYHYAYRFPSNLAAGTYWYHPHPHTQSAAQTAGGMSGLIIVDGLKKYLPESLRGIRERVVALKDFQVQGDQVKTEGLKIGSPTHRTVNGQLNPVIDIRPGEVQLWRIANISANIFYKVALPGRKFHVIARDANPVNTIYSADSIVIPAAARFDVLVEGGRPGTSELQTLPYNTGSAGNQFPRATLATVVSQGRAMAPVKIPTAFAPTRDLSNAKIAARKTITFTENAQGTQFFINGKQFDMNRTDFRAKLNTVEEWTVRNQSDEVHSFHTHTDDFQLMSKDGVPVRFYGWRDTVDISPRGESVIRIRFSDYVGRTVLHCHILNHEDAGMMATLEIVGDQPANGAGKEPIPHHHAVPHA